MITKKKYLLLTVFLVIIFQILLFINNKQKVSLRYFKWTVQEVNIGKLISISYFSGLFISAILNITITGHKKTLEHTEENYEPLENEESIKSDIEMPPQRNIRDSQPTISVNYRVVKNTEGKNNQRDQNYSKSPDNLDDWFNDDNDW